MYLSHTITSYLGKREVSYETVTHPRSLTAGETASRAHVPRQKLVKGVLFCDDDSYTLAAVPTSSRVDPAALASLLNRKTLLLAGEDELAMMFPDCEIGAVPALGSPYGVPTVVDVALLMEQDLYIEAGDHRRLLHLDGNDFRRLMHGIPRGVISHRVGAITRAPTVDPSPCR